MEWTTLTRRSPTRNHHHYVISTCQDYPIIYLYMLYSDQCHSKLLVAPTRVCLQIRPHRNMFFFFHSEHYICQNEVAIITFDTCQLKYYFCYGKYIALINVCVCVLSLSLTDLLVDVYKPNHM